MNIISEGEVLHHAQKMTTCISDSGLILGSSLHGCKQVLKSAEKKQFENTILKVKLMCYLGRSYMIYIYIIRFNFKTDLYKNTRMNDRKEKRKLGISNHKKLNSSCEWKKNKNDKLHLNIPILLTKNQNKNDIFIYMLLN